MNQTVYNIATGEAVTVSGIDAKEYLATGGWSQTPPVIDTVPEPEIEQPVKRTRKLKTVSETI